MKKKSHFHIEPKHIFFFLTAVCLILIIVSSVSNSVNNALRNGINTVLMPMQRGLNQVGSFVFGEAENLAELKRVQDENAQLSEEVAQLREDNTRYQLQLAELDKYKELLDMKEQYPDFETTGAHIISKNSGNWYRTVKIDKGSADGIQVSMNVIADGGLVGIVTSVETHTATISTIIDDGRSVGAMAQLSQDPCIVTGDLLLYDEGRLLLQHINKDDDVENGYKIVTSNTSSEYLPGILIGYAEGLEIESNTLTKSGYLIPVVDFAHLDSVLVITTLKETGAAN